MRNSASCRRGSADRMRELRPATAALRGSSGRRRSMPSGGLPGPVLRLRTARRRRVQTTRHPGDRRPFRAVHRIAGWRARARRAHPREVPCAAGKALHDTTPRRDPPRRGHTRRMRGQRVYRSPPPESARAGNLQGSRAAWSTPAAISSPAVPPGQGRSQPRRWQMCSTSHRPARMRVRRRAPGIRGVWPRSRRSPV